MYKNISLTHSLLFLLLFIPSALLSMEENFLEQSFIMPEDKGLGFLNTIFYLASDDEQVMNAVIYDLETGKFDATNGSKIKLFNEAIKTACQKKDKNKAAKILLYIAELCDKNEKYASVRITDNNVAQQSFEIVSQFYLSKLELAQKEQLEHEQWNQQKTTIFNCVQRINEAVSLYDEAMKNTNHDPENVTKKIKSFKLFHKTIRTPIDDLLANNQLQNTAILSPTKNHAPDELIAILTNINQTIGASKPKQRIILALEDQK